MMAGVAEIYFNNVTLTSVRSIWKGDRRRRWDGPDYRVPSAETQCLDHLINQTRLPKPHPRFSPTLGSRCFICGSRMFAMRARRARLGARVSVIPLKRRFKSQDLSPRHRNLRQSQGTTRDLSETRTLGVATALSSAPSGGDPSQDGRDESTWTRVPDPVQGFSHRPLYVDQLLQTRQSTGRTQNASFILGIQGRRELLYVIQKNQVLICEVLLNLVPPVASSSMSFFSDSRLDALSACLGNNALRSLISRISGMVKSRVQVLNRNFRPSSIWNRLGEIPVLSPGRARHLIEIYFENIHPLYPFLDRHEFETRAFSPTLDDDLANDVAWAALYHTVLALGCEFNGGGSFAPGEGEAWSLFKVALDLYPRVLLLNTDLLEVQAIFCLNMSGTQIEGKILSEAARVAQRAFLNKASTGSDATIRSRVFWVVYYIEKTVSFHTGCTSFIVDCDIGSPIPLIEEAIFEDFDWFFTSIKFARLYSRIFTELFSITATKNSRTTYLSTISEFEELLEQQCQAIPPRFRPGVKLRPQAFSHPCGLNAALRVHYHYHELKIALHRLKLHVTRDQIAPRPSSDMAGIMNSARAVIEITRVIQQEPSTPFFVIFFMPFTALFILFDQIIQDPTHEDTHGNLALLESVTGYFSALEYATNGYLPGSMLMPFASIARQFHSTSHASRGDNVSNENSDKGTTSEQSTTEMLGVEPSTHSQQIPWEVSAEDLSVVASQPNIDYSSQILSSAPSNNFMLSDSRLTPGLEIMDLFCGPAHGADFFFPPN
ncbi:hypothetical protein ANOM_001125 [Aspergillus nomiae NRRL 13137]|uniref:Xylanolytic transcriptional activator regulatory domain-containing protein n=1 Tax=Aspergillus nomiae NRRL (strain ATCC 15546 / NRRL 13137 / CBS 260.88 / M93) TaxID=1509407 RepID=A0A0L1JG76_ASPN3|nr:uncharacterized protein ANOM_001125 [Aspergillus nomiae NRRL 13137]KNG90707.1 hypothetical protein ANOM_001125 [Aspergillus nomiae NRRL 13137]